MKGTKASWIKHGIDPQEDQLRADIPLGVLEPLFGVGEFVHLFYSTYGGLTTYTNIRGREYQGGSKHSRPRRKDSISSSQIRDWQLVCALLTCTYQEVLNASDSRAWYQNVGMAIQMQDSTRLAVKVVAFSLEPSGKLISLLEGRARTRRDVAH